MRLIGITGGIGAGKSEILSYIEKHYRCRITLADEVAHQVREPGSGCFDKLAGLLGKDVLTPEGTIDRGRMAERIFKDALLLEQVNAIIHPAVREYLTEEIEKASRDNSTELFFIEAALLIEAGYSEIVDEMWYIHASPMVRAERLKNSRGYSEEKSKSIMDRQLTEEAFRRECDFTIDNSTTLEGVYRQINKRLEAFTWQN